MILGLFTKPFLDADDWRKFSMLELMMEFNRPSFYVYHPGEPRSRSTLNTSRRIEGSFFKETPPWSTFINRSSLGIDALLTEVRRISDRSDPMG